jgi:choline dehydrogenase-like flavoprotein
LVNLNFPDTRRDDNFVTLELEDRKSAPTLRINYAPRSDEARVIQKALRKVKRALRRLNCIVPPGMIHVRPMGASVHYAGTIPFSGANRRFTTSESCQSHDFNNLYIVDGTTFPFLPSKNITFTLMANAVRAAESAF